METIQVEIVIIFISPKTDHDCIVSIYEDVIRAAHNTWNILVSKVGVGFNEYITYFICGFVEYGNIALVEHAEGQQFLSVSQRE